MRRNSDLLAKTMDAATSARQEELTQTVAAPRPTKENLVRGIIFAFFQFTITEIFFAVSSLVYLAFILVDLIIDEVTQIPYVCTENSTEPMLPSESFTTRKADLVVRVDLAFLSFFVVETALRIVATGPRQYLRDPFNAIDAAVLVLGVAVDLVVLFADGSSTFGFIRMVRLMRLVRIASTYKRLKQRRKLYELRKHSLLYRAEQLPYCEWVLAPQRRYAAFVSHNKHDSAHAARFLHCQLQLMLQQDVFFDSVDLVDFRDIFAFHLDVSESIVCLVSARFFYSPWCLLVCLCLLNSKACPPCMRSSLVLEPSACTGDL